tara:strand:+ start:2850 stop:3023 length:174 start_codon:yes stop_codon:yes gene_type:complete
MNSQKGYKAMHTMQAQHAAHNEAGKHMKGFAVLTVIALSCIAAPLYGFSALAMMFAA